MSKASQVVSARLSFVAALVAAALVLSWSFARAEEAANETSPVDEFSKQLELFQKSVPDLNKKI